MTHIRIFRQYIPVQLLILIVIEYGLLWLAVYGGYYLRFGAFDDGTPPVAQGLSYEAHAYALVMVISMIAMGAYQLRGAEGLTGLMLRAMVAIFLIGTVLLSAAFFLLPDLHFFLGRGVLAVASVLAIVMLVLVRVVFYKFMDVSRMRWRVVIMGAGHRARRVLDVMEGDSSADLEIIGCITTRGNEVAVPEELVLQPESSLYDFCSAHKVQEIVVAVDERRRGRGENGGGFPLEQLLDCKLAGIDVRDELSFYEREMGKIDTRLLSPGWLVFSTGFSFSPLRDIFERAFDLIASSLLLLVTWPFMLFTAIAIKLEDGLRAPVIYSQERVGYRGRIFRVHKFRSMQVDAEKDGVARWAQASDTRVTRVGNFIRNTRIDELPQIFNVLKGQMSFVGPRPERPQFVEELAKQIPFYNERHRVKPGITGWAQLCYPYGASVEDAEQKLQYDLYYIKNHSLIFDLFILVRTVEVILLGHGVR